MPNNIPVAIANLRQQKQSLLTMINGAAQAFVKKTPDPIKALQDPKVLAMVKKLHNLRARLVAFLDAVENYMNSSGTDLVFALDHMLNEMLLLKKVIEDLKPTANESANVAIVRAEIGSFVDQLLASVPNDEKKRNTIQILIDTVPRNLIWGAMVVASIAPDTASDVIAIKVRMAGGAHALKVLETLKIKDAMFQAAFTRNPLEPLNQFFVDLLTALKPKKKEELESEESSKKEELESEESSKKEELESEESSKKEALESEESSSLTSTTENKTYSTPIVEEARVALVDGIDKKVKDIVASHSDVLSLASDTKVLEKIGKLSTLKESVVSFLDATQDYLLQSALNPGVPQLTLLMQRLKILEQAMIDLQPSENPTAAEIFIQKEIDKFVDELLKEDSVIFKLIAELDKSYILSYALKAIQAVDPTLERASGVAKYLDTSMMPISRWAIGDLTPLIDALKSTSLPTHIASNAQSSNEILSNYFKGVLGNLHSQTNASDQHWKRTIEVVSLRDIITALEKKGEDPRYQDLLHYVKKLDALLNEKSIKNNYTPQADAIKSKTVVYIMTYVDITIDGLNNYKPGGDIKEGTIAYKNDIVHDLKAIGEPGIVARIGALLGALIGAIVNLFSKPLEGALEGATAVGGLNAAYWFAHLGSPSAATTAGIAETVEKSHPKLGS